MTNQLDGQVGNEETNQIVYKRDTHGHFRTMGEAMKQHERANRVPTTAVGSLARVAMRIPATSTEKVIPVSTPGRLRPPQARAAPNTMPPMTKAGVAFFMSLLWRTLQKPMAAIASK